MVPIHVFFIKEISKQCKINKKQITYSDTKQHTFKKCKQNTVIISYHRRTFTPYGLVHNQNQKNKSKLKIDVGEEQQGFLYAASSTKRFSQTRMDIADVTRKYAPVSQSSY